MSFHRWLGRREYGVPNQFGDRDYIMKHVYSTLGPCNSWNDWNPNLSSEYGAVFNLEFSPDGNILAAACEKKAIILFDVIGQTQTERIMDAHTDNVNCIKFLDNNTFATCSDDTTVAIWDVRSLKKRLRSLRGHSNWVKNIEYSKKDGLLVTSGFDGSIFTWDINSYTEEGLIYQKVFHTSGLMRCRISPDCNKLVICTTGGYLMIIHNLDLTTLHKDLCGFRPSIYRLMQMGNQYIPQAAKYDYIFSKKMKRNRVELVTDFPNGNDAEIILALQIHPNGLSFLSRNISYDERSEWSCIHDLHEESYDITLRRPDKRKRKLIDDDETHPSTSSGKKSGSRTTRRCRRTVDLLDLPSTSAGLRAQVSSTAQEADVISAVEVSESNGGTTSQGVTTRNGTSTYVNVENNDPPGSNTSPNRPEFVPDIWAAEITIQERAARLARGRQPNSVTGYDFVYAIASGILPVSSTNSNTDATNSHDCSTVLQKERRILQNAKKLMYYIEESNKDRGFIKEPSFSSDGRIICSPYSTGVRLLSYEPDCSQYTSIFESERLKKNPKQLVQIKTLDCHEDIVLSTSFSPKQPLLVTGCKLGKVMWHYPNL